MKKHKLLAVFLALVMTLSLLPTAALAEGEITVNSQETLNTLVASGGTGVLEGDLEVTFPSAVNKNVTLNLNNHKLTLANTEDISISESNTLTITSGSILANHYTAGTYGVFIPEANASVTLNSVNMTTTGAALFPAGNASAVTVTDSVITAGTYVVGTNASSGQSNNVNINLSNSTFSTTGYVNNDRDTCTVMINVPGTLNVSNCTIKGGRQAVLVRAGTASISNSEIVLEDLYDGTDKDNYENGNWGSGNNLPMGALVVGNRSASSYQSAANCTLTNTSVTGGRIYTYGNTGTNIGATLTINNNAEGKVVDSAFVKGNEAANIIIQGGTFSDSSALNYLASGANIKLGSDITVTSPVTLDKDVTIDLNGHNITGQADRVFNVKGGNVVITGTGMISVTEGIEDASSVIRVGDNSGDARPASLTIDKNVTVKSDYSYGITVFGRNTTKTLTVDGTVTTKAVPAISGNGSDGYGNTTITINGTVEATEENAIYHPQSGTLTINGTVKGKGGIEAKAGETIVVGDGAVITATATDTTHNANSNGCSTSGYAIAVVENSSYAGGATVTVKGGTVEGPIGIIADNEVAPGEKGSISITGGTFSTDPEAYLATDYVTAIIGGKYVVGLPHIVSFDANGGAGTMAFVSGISGTYTLPANEFTAPTGKQFEGWATSSDGAVISGNTYEVSADTTFYAMWKEIPAATYTVTVNGSYSTMTGAGTYAEGAAVNIFAGDRSNYAFTGWTSDDVSISGASSKNASFTMPGQNVTVTANWSYIGGSSSSGGSSGGGSSTSTTTEKNPDGSTTTTTTNKTTGTVTETTKNTDGSTTTVETKKDGTVTETVKTADGTTGTVVSDKNGDVTEAKATVSTKAATEAAKTGEAVTLPVEVPAAKTTEDAPSVQVTVPKSAGSVKVEIPVEKVTPGTVAVIVNADGTEKIVSTSMVTENGVALNLDGNATVKIIDNTKTFSDVPESNVFYNEISSLSAREIMVGKTDDTFDLHNDVTLNQVANVAGRITGEVDVKDFNAGIAWGNEKGLKTGNEAATRGDVLKALYIAAGSPAVADTSILARFNDATRIPADMAAIVAWAAQNGILKGGLDGNASLNANVTRGQACALAGRAMGTMA